MAERAHEAPPSRQFLTPSELCERWDIDVRTLNKLPLQWVWLTPMVRRVALEDVRAFEQANLRDSS